MKYPIANIKIGPRQREADALGDIEALADSMQRLGQFHSIGLLPDGTLVWGRRRTEAARLLGWTEIEAVVREDLTADTAYEIELEEDIRREGRTWQSEVTSVAALFHIKARRARELGEPFGTREMARFTGFGKSMVANYVHNIAVALNAEPRDNEVWNASGPTEALDILRTRAERQAYDEIQRRQATAAAAIANSATANSAYRSMFRLENTAIGEQKDRYPEQRIVIGSEGPVQEVDKTPLPLAPVPRRLFSLRERVTNYNNKFDHLAPPNTPLFYIKKNEREFIHGFWFVGGGNISDFYGSYQVEYLNRINALFTDIQGKREVVHLFSGSIPISSDYTVVGLPDNGNQPDVVCDAHNLSSGLGFSPTLIYADPPYSKEDSEHYANAMVDRARVLSECAVVLKPGGYVVWLDQALPVFSNDELQLVGAIGYIRSTGNRFRMVTIFQKPLSPTCKPTPSSPQETTPTQSP